MKKSTEKKIMSLLNKPELAKGLDYLSLRWKDEKEYEDWNDYATQIEKLAGIPILKATKRPFGFTANIDGEKVSVFIKIQGNQISLSAKANWK